MNLEQLWQRCVGQIASLDCTSDARSVPVRVVTRNDSGDLGTGDLVVEAGLNDDKTEFVITVG